MEDTQGVTEVNADPTTEDLMEAGGKEFDKEQAEEAKSESPTDETSQPEKTDEVVKTTGDEKADDEVTDDGNPIPYARFKKLVDERNSTRDELSQIRKDKEALQSDYDGLSSPSVLRFSLQEKGYNEDQIKQYFYDNQIPYKEPEAKVDPNSQFADLSKKYDLNSQEGWIKAFKDIAKMETKGALKSVEGKLSEQEQYRRDEEVKIRMAKTEASAKELAEKHKIPYGEYKKDENNPSTAVGLMWGYLKNNPEDASLGHSKILKLALSESGIKIGEQKGLEKAEQHNKIKKSAAMETEGVAVGDEEPGSDASVQEIMAWAERHPDKI